MLRLMTVFLSDIMTVMEILIGKQNTEIQNIRNLGIYGVGNMHLIHQIIILV